ncbi:MAG: diguanylate cyclase [Rhodocyclaceae bacterium]|nr:diguanylate cyclase [Rhodocyclaceae bacterium]
MKASNAPSTRDNGSLDARTEHCYRQLPIALAVTLVNGAILVVVLWDAVDATVMVGWAALLCAVTGARYANLRAYRRRPRAGALALVRWRRRFAAGALAGGLVWGLAGALLFHPDSFPHQVFLAFLLGGMLAGAIPLLSALHRVYPLFAIPASVPIATQMLLVGDHIHLVMALLMAIFSAAMLASSAQVHSVFREAEHLRRELSSSIEASHELERLVRLDTLTGIANRRMFEEGLWREWRRAERDRGVVAVISADIDHFKEYNDHYGHPAGDRCLVKVAQAMAQALSRPGDVVARIGGEEFAFVLPGTGSEGARAVAEQVRERVLALQLPHAASSVSPTVTVSFGVAATDCPSVATPTDLMRASDAALYEAKRLGRNRVEVICE